MTSTDTHRERPRILTELRRRFGHERLRPGQTEVIDRVLRGQNTLAVMPTGAGKSLCYQLPACLLPGLTVVVSPLIALIADQHAKLTELGLCAVQLHSGREAEALRDDESALSERRAKIAFVTPERLSDPAFTALLKDQVVSLLVVDEAHCISQWGDDFRPAYSDIGAAHASMGQPTVLALTATATDEVAADIAGQLHIPPDGILLRGGYRRNLQLSVESFADDAAKQARAVDLLRAAEGPTIAYASTIKAAQSLHEALTQAGLQPLLYHGRLPAKDKNEAQRLFFEASRPRVMVATNAFGLGIDKPDIRMVLHVQMPAGLDTYYQEAGRAGRDGAPALCTLLFRSADRAVQQFFINGKYPAVEDGQALWRALGNPPGPQASWTVAELADHLGRPPTKVRVLVNALRREDWVTFDQQGGIRPQGQRDPAQLDSLLQRFITKGQDDRARLEAMVFYGQTGGCRWRVLLDGLGETAPFDRCGHCDNCLRMAAHQRRVAEEDAEPAAQAQVEQPARFAAGQLVRVRRYGQGMVVEASAESVTVEFADGERRCFDPGFVRLVRPRKVPRKSP